MKDKQLFALVLQDRGIMAVVPFDEAERSSIMETSSNQKELQRMAKHYNDQKIADDQEMFSDHVSF